MEKGSSSSAGGGADSLNGLKFGKKIYFEGMGSKTGGGSPSSPAKKGKTGVVHGGGPPRCQVEGCKVDLSDAKAYYSRHKVCCIHSKADNVIVAGIIQRFCQQCSRFHKKTEFDDGKRSCRRRLACHNERRRKPPPGTIMSSSPHYATLSPTTSLSSNLFDTHSKTGSFVMDFSRTYPSLTGRESWPHTTTNLGLANQLPWQTNSPTNPNYLQGSINRPSFSSPGVNSVDSFNGVSDSSSALSLLSIQPWAGSRTRSTSLEINNFLGSNGAATMVQPSLNPGQFACPSWGFKGNETNTGLNEMPPDLGLSQIAHQGNNQYTSGELGLGQPSEGRFNGLDHSRGYDSFG